MTRRDRSRPILAHLCPDRTKVNRREDLKLFIKWILTIFEITCIWDIRGSHDSSNLFHVLQIRAESTVAAENLLIDQGCDWQAIETILNEMFTENMENKCTGKGLPKFD